jgi:hypothetical protein
MLKTISAQGNIFLVGGTGVGKSTLAKKLAAQRGLIHVQASEWFRKNFNGAGITGKQAFTDAITAFSRQALARDPDLNVRYLHQAYHLEAGGHVIEGCRNPRDFEQLFDPQRDTVVIIHYPQNPVRVSTFEAEGLRLIHGITQYYVDIGMLDYKRFLPFTISSVGGPSHACNSEADKGPVVEHTIHLWNMDELTRFVLDADWIKQVPTLSATGSIGEVHCPIPNLKVRVAQQYLYDMDPAKTGSWVSGTAFAVSSHVGHAPTFQLLLGDGGLFSYIPAEALRHGPDISPDNRAQLLDPEDLVYHGCRSPEIVVTRYGELAGLPVRAYFKRGGVWQDARYHCTIDWHTGNDLLHVLLLENGQVALLPSHKVLFGEGVVDKLPPYKKLRATFERE